ncbi:hypothetical protein GCM10027347_23230 [Larkinella harenae]
MKKIKFLCLPVFFLISLTACQNPLENVTLGFKDPIENGVVEIRFRSLKGTIPKNVDLTIVGNDADQIVTTLNTTNYKVNDDGVLLLAASPEADYSQTNPLQFIVAAKASGHLDIIQPVQLADTGRSTLSPAWINLSDPPAHLSAVQQTGINTPLSAGATLTTPAVNQKKDNVTVSIESGTELKDVNGTTLTGPFTAAIYHIENRGNNSAAYLPTGSVMRSVRGQNGANLGSLQLSQLTGVFSLEFYNEDYRIAQQLSKPSTVVMTLNPETIDPADGRAIQAGDNIQFYRYDRFSAHWQQEKPGVISRNASGQLECRLSVSQPGLWVAGWTQAVCDEGPIFTINSALNQVDIQFLCKVVDADTRQEITSFYSSLNNGTRITLQHLQQNRRVRFQVFNYNNAYSSGNPGQPFFETAPLQTCNTVPQGLDLQRFPVSPAITVSFDFVCPPPTRLNESLLPTRLRLQYSEAGKRQWSDLITLNRSNLRALSYKLQVRKPYDIRVSTDGGATWPLERARFVPDNNTLSFELASPEFCK